MLIQRSFLTCYNVHLDKGTLLILLFARHAARSKSQTRCTAIARSRIATATFIMKYTKRFAPLDPAHRQSSDAAKLKGIIFDVDGTLWYVMKLLFIAGRNNLEASGFSGLAHVSRFISIIV